MIARYKQFTDEEFTKLVLESESVADLMRKLGYASSTGNSRIPIIQRCQQLNLPVPSLPMSLQTRKAIKCNTLSDEEYFIKGKTRKGATTYKRLLDLGYANKCSVCGIDAIWNNKPLNLQVDHIDGDHDNNQLDNLRLICPNCHSQTDTFCGKNILSLRNTKEENYCVDCGKVISRGAIRCIECANKQKEKSNKPSKEQLYTDICNLSFADVGIKYQVSENRIRIWCKSYDLPHNKKDLKKYQSNLTV